MMMDDFERKNLAVEENNKKKLNIYITDYYQD